MVQEASSHEDRGPLALCGGLIAAYAAVMLLAAAAPAWGITAFFVQLGVLTLFGLVHGSARYGWASMLVFLALMWVVVNLLENLSIVTGVPFGQFQHTAAMGPKLFHVPVVVGFAYFSAGYLAWIMAALLLGETDRERGPLALLATPVVAMFIVTGWDACIDPIGGTVARNWIWPEGGGYFGVPLSNYAGWMVTAFVAFQLFALWLAARGGGVTGGQSRGWWLLPALQFGVMSLQYPLNLLVLPDAAITDPGGTTWQTGDIYEGTTVVSLFTMLFVAVTAALVALRRPG